MHFIGDVSGYGRAFFQYATKEVPDKSLWFDLPNLILDISKKILTDCPETLGKIEKVARAMKASSFSWCLPNALRSFKNIGFGLSSSLSYGDLLGVCSFSMFFCREINKAGEFFKDIDFPFPKGVEVLFGDLAGYALDGLRVVNIWRCVEDLKRGYSRGGTKNFSLMHKVFCGVTIASELFFLGKKVFKVESAYLDAIEISFRVVSVGIGVFRGTLSVYEQNKKKSL